MEQLVLFIMTRNSVTWAGQTQCFGRKISSFTLGLAANVHNMHLTNPYSSIQCLLQGLILFSLQSDHLPPKRHLLLFALISLFWVLLELV